LLEQRVAHLCDAAVELVAAAGAGMRALGQPPEGGIDRGQLECALKIAGKAAVALGGETVARRTVC